jgi:hypothetical protein
MEWVDAKVEQPKTKEKVIVKYQRGNGQPQAKYMPIYKKDRKVITELNGDYWEIKYFNWIFWLRE